MAAKKWYEALFENYSGKYDNEIFVQGTGGECDFIEKEIGFNKSIKIIDIGCGTGRHTLELTKRGYDVTGIDLSEGMLKKARQKAAEMNLHVNFEKHDARALPFKSAFDAAIMLCEGGFPLMETDEMNFDILRNIAEALRPGSRFIFTTLNGLFPLFKSVNEFHNSVHKEGNARYDSYSFDLMTFRDHNITTIEDDNGNLLELDCNERYYVPSEITWLLKSLGFISVEIFAAKLGAYSRNDKLTPEDYEMLVVARK